MEKRHKDIIISYCPEMDERTIVWNIDDPYYLSASQAEEVFNQIKNKVNELLKSRVNIEKKAN
jgi:protein-tyrosine-phosphatase